MKKCLIILSVLYVVSLTAAPKNLTKRKKEHGRRVSTMPMLAEDEWVIVEDDSASYHSKQEKFKNSDIEVEQPENPVVATVAPEGKTMSTIVSHEEERKDKAEKKPTIFVAAHEEQPAIQEVEHSVRERGNKPCSRLRSLFMACICVNDNCEEE